MSTLTVSNITGLSTLSISTNTATFGTSVYMTASGNVGVGNASPPTKLTANGTIRSSSAGGSGYVDIRHDGTNAALVGNTGSLLVYAEGLNSIIFHTNAAQRAIIDSSGNFQFNSGYGSVATAFGCRAWVNFNGTGTVAIRGSGNITSITDNGLGDYTVNFTTAMPDTNYAIAGMTQNNGTSPPSAYVSIGPGSAGTTTNYLLTNSARISTAVHGVGAAADSGYVTVAVFR